MLYSADILKPSSSQLSIASSHSNTSNSDPHAVDDNDDGKVGILFYSFSRGGDNSLFA